MRDHRYEHQIHKAPGFNLLVTAIILRTTKYLEASITDLRNNGLTIPNDIVQHVALLGWAHVGLTGVYLRNMRPTLRPDRPRPLRTLETQERSDRLRALGAIGSSIMGSRNCTSGPPSVGAFCDREV